MKYAGSKRRLCKELIPILQNYIDKYNIETYIEPFVGGANVIDKIKCKNKIGYDINKYLIALFNKFKEGWIPPEDITKEDYKKVEKNKDDYEDYYVGLIGFCATYNAVWFHRYGGKATTKEGKVRNYYQEAVRNIQKQIPSLMDVKLKVGDYINLNVNNCLIYCDPPYGKSYEKMYENDFDSEIYWNKVRELSKNNIVICSEYDSPEDFICIFEKQLTNSFKNKINKKEYSEKLFIHKDLYNKLLKFDEN